MAPTPVHGQPTNSWRPYLTALRRPLRKAANRSTRLKSMTMCLYGAMALSLVLTPVWGHHSFSGTYREDAPPEEIRGTLKSFNVRNPHSFVQVEDETLKDKDGSPVR